MINRLPAAKYALMQIGREDSNGNPSLYIDGNLLFRIFIHSRSSLEKPVQGIFYGQILSWKQVYYLDVENTKEIEILDLTKVLEKEIEGEKVLGFYYSQPGQGVILNEKVLSLATSFFSKHYQFLFLVDPLLRRYAIFQWDNEKLQLIPGFKATCLPEKKEQLKQLLFQTDFNYVEKKIEKKVFPLSSLQAYQQIEEEEEKKEVKASFLLNRLSDYREVFLSKDILVKDDLRSQEQIKIIIEEVLEKLKNEVPIKALIRMYWETRPGDNRYFADNWICEIRWMGNNEKYSLLWNEEKF